MNKDDVLEKFIEADQGNKTITVFTKRGKYYAFKVMSVKSNRAYIERCDALETFVVYYSDTYSIEFLGE